MFELDSIVTKQEILPTIAKELGMYQEMCSLTESTVRGEIPFRQNFLQKVELLKKTPVSKVKELINNIKLNDKLIDFMIRNKERCYIATENLDVWIDTLIKRIGMEKTFFVQKPWQRMIIYKRCTALLTRMP